MTSYALIADPDPVSASSYAAVLRQMGLTALVARGGGVAVAALVERGVPALLLTELELPGQSGLELIESLRRSAPVTQTRVIAVSADRALRDRAAAVRARLFIDAILAKAASEESLKRVVLHLLGPQPGAEVPPPEPGARGGAARGT